MGRRTPLGDVLVLRPGALGDALLAVPALRAIRRAFPGARVALGSHAAAAALLEACGEVDAGRPFDSPELAWVFDPAGEPPGPAPRAVVAWRADPGGSLVRSLQARGFGTVVVAPSRPLDGLVRHSAEHLLSTLGPLVADVALDARPLRIQAPRRGDVLLHPGSGAPRKNWPPPRFAAVAAKLLEQDIPVWLVVGEADALAAGELEAALGHRLPRLTVPSLGELAARLAGCRAYVGNDSGVSHLAGLVGARTLALFGPTAPEMWRPLGPDVVVLPFDTRPERVAELAVWRARPQAEPDAPRPGRARPA